MIAFTVSQVSYADNANGFLRRHFLEFFEKARGNRDEVNAQIYTECNTLCFFSTKSKIVCVTLTVTTVDRHLGSCEQDFVIAFSS